MATATFTSFHYQRDYWRVQQVLNIGTIDGQAELSPQKWESVKKKGPAAVEAWINEEMAYKRAVIVLVGTETSTRKYVKYEIQRAWDLKKPLLGIAIHGLKDKDGNTSAAGGNPFKQFGFSDSSRTFADYVPLFTPSGSTSNARYTDISRNLSSWLSKGYKRP
jgi:hypothetical protein